MAGTNYKTYQEGVIRSLLVMPEALVDVLEIISSEDFDDVNYQLVFQAILDLYSAKEPISLPNITLKVGELGGSVDPAWILSLEDNMVEWVTRATPIEWAKLVHKESIKKMSTETLKNALMSVETEESLDIIEKLKEDLTDIALRAMGNSNLTASDYLDQFEEENKQIEEEGGLATGIPSPYPTLDYYTGGWKPGQLITIGARTSIGKTVFAMNSAMAAAAADKSVLFFSLEMNEREFFSRMLASHAMVVIKDIEEHRPLSTEEADRLREAKEFIRNSKMHVDFEPRVTLEYIRSRALRQSQSEDGLDMVIVDYLQLIESTGNSRRSRQEEVAVLSRGMKQLAQELGVPVMIIVQVNRKNADNPDDEQIPTLDNIRESAAIGQDSNIVVLLHRKLAENNNEEIDPKGLFILAKNRQGGAGKFISVRTALEYNLFLDDSRTGQAYLDKLDEAEQQGQLQNFNPEDIPEMHGGFQDENFIGDAPDTFEHFSDDDIEDMFLGDDNFDLF